MRKYLVFLFLVALFGCVMPTSKKDEPEGQLVNVWVHNSAWDVVRSDTLASREVTSLDALQEEVNAYNQAHTDDQWFLETGEEETPIEEAEDATAWIVNSATLDVYWTGTVKRADLQERREEWRIAVEAMADPVTLMLVPCTLYVDRLPPEPPVIVEPEPLLWVALVDYTNHNVYFSEKFDNEEDAKFRYYGLGLQAEQNINGWGEYPAGWDWRAYLGSTEFHF